MAQGPTRQEQELITQVLTMRLYPERYVQWAFPWGRPGTPFAALTGPRSWQMAEFRQIGEHVRRQAFAADNELPLEVWRSAYSSGRGPGKSAFFGMLANWFVSCWLGAPCLVAANTETQLRTTTFPEFAKWFGAAINSHWWLVEGMRISPQPWLTDRVRADPSLGGLKIDPEYWGVFGKTWTEESPEAFVGPHSMIGLMTLFDEANGIHSSIWDRTEGFYTEQTPTRFLLAASQMRTRSGRFYEIFYDEKMGAGWHKRTLSTRSMEGIDPAVIKQQIERYGEDSDFVRVEIDGLPPRTSEDQFIPHAAVQAAQQNKLVYDYGEPLILGIDPAPRGKTAWRFRQGRNARDCVGSATAGSWNNLDNVQIAEKIIAFDNTFRPDAICIDFGMGTGVIDVLKRRRLNAVVHEVRFGDMARDRKGEWETHAAELWARMREWLPGGMIEPDAGEKGTLSFQLTNRGWRWSGREEGKKILEKKEDLMKRGVASPDDADALACTFEVNPPRREERASVTQIAAGVDQNQFGE